MSDAEQSPESNQNAQNSADIIMEQDDLDETESFGGRVPIDLDAGFNLEDLIRQAMPKSSPKVEEKPVPAPEPLPVIPTVDPAELIALKAQIDQEKNNTLRALADLQNYRRRADDEKSRIIRDANERLIKEILPIFDDFERGLNAAREAQSYEQIVGGVESVLRKMTDVLKRQGVEAIPTVGEAFNPDLHEAVSVQSSEEVADETVLQELRKGYKLHGRVIRPALVVVAQS